MDEQAIVPHDVRVRMELLYKYVACDNRGPVSKQTEVPRSVLLLYVL